MECTEALGHMGKKKNRLNRRTEDRVVLLEHIKLGRLDIQCLGLVLYILANPKTEAGSGGRNKHERFVSKSRRAQNFRPWRYATAREVANGHVSQAW